MKLNREPEVWARYFKDDDFHLSESGTKNALEDIGTLFAEVERLRSALLHIECMNYSDADELREIARQALTGDTE